MKKQNTTVPFLDLKLTEKSIRSKIDSRFSEIIDTCAFVGGRHVADFAEEFARFCSAEGCVPVANGTDALILALRALGVGPGSEVITVPYTFIATSEAVGAVGGTVKFVDVEPATFTMDPAQLEKAISSRTKAIIPVHLYGQSADMDPIVAIARKHNLAVIEDAAQAHGATYKGKPVGALGDAGCFSFYPTKNLGGFGDGGAVVSNLPDLLARIAQLADHGRSGHYLHAIEGVNSRLDALQAAVLSVKLAKLRQWNRRRQQIAGQYDRALRGHRHLGAPAVRASCSHVYHLYSVLTEHRDQLALFLRERGIASAVYYGTPLHLQPAYAGMGLREGSFPVTERLAKQLLALPMFPYLKDAQVSEVCRSLKAFAPN